MEYFLLLCGLCGFPRQPGSLLNLDVFPFDNAIFTGKLSESRIRREHPLELERILAAEKSAKGSGAPRRCEPSLTRTEARARHGAGHVPAQCRERQGPTPKARPYGGSAGLAHSLPSATIQVLLLAPERR